MSAVSCRLVFRISGEMDEDEYNDAFEQEQGIEMPTSDASVYDNLNPYTLQHDGKRTFITDVPVVQPEPQMEENTTVTTLPSIPGASAPSTPQAASLEQQIMQTEQYMLACERSANYREAERSKRHLDALRASLHEMLRDRLFTLQSEDVRLFVEMIERHQLQFDQLWEEKQHEHKLRANELIDALKVGMNLLFEFL